MNTCRRKYIRISSLAEWSKLYRRSLNGIGLLMGASGLTAGLICGGLMNWEEAAEDFLEGPFLKWAEGQTHRVTFLPEEVIIELGKDKNGNPLKDKNGEPVYFYRYQVTLHDGGRDRKKVISTSAKLFIEQLLAYQKRKALIGKTFDIKATGVNTQRRYQVTPVD